MTATRRPARNQVRIIAGEWRSRLIRFPDIAHLRPTPDRVRETLFNWLGQRLDGLDCIDLFAGSGALAFEALSRGARSVVMLERDRAIAAALRDNAQVLQARDASVVEAEAIKWLTSCGKSFDVAFVDPPYASDLAPAALAALAPCMRPGGRAYVESGASLPAQDLWRPLREDRAGAVRYGLYQLVTP